MPKMTFLDSVALKTWRSIKISISVFWTDATHTSYSRESKNAFYKNCFQIKVVTNQNSQLLYCATFFDIWPHFGDIAAYLTHRESIVRLTEQIF